MDILEVASRDLPREKEGLNMMEVARCTRGWSGAELRGVCREAAMCALRAGRRTVLQGDLVGAVAENARSSGAVEEFPAMSH